MKNKICVLSGRYPETEFDSFVNHKVYCEKHGYAYIYCNWPSKAKNLYLNKMAYIKEYYNYFDYIFWIDDDAFFIDMNKRLEEIKPIDGSFLSICKSPDFKQLKTYFSSGQFMLRCNDIGRSFIDEVSLMDLNKVKTWWREELGFFSNGDQDAMVYLCLESDKFKDSYTRWNYKEFNSRPQNFTNKDPHSVFILHFTGKKSVKRSDYKMIQRTLNLNRSLVANKNLIEWNYKDESSLIKLLKTLVRFLLCL